MTPTVQTVLQDILDHPQPPVLRSCACQCATWHPERMGCDIATDGPEICGICAEIIDQAATAFRVAYPELWATPGIGG